jgi:hypothetical protein
MDYGFTCIEVNVMIDASTNLSQQLPALHALVAHASTTRHM